ncbi:hypothetical protein IC232_05405 [Microvirga sp. BT688]|uniref:hypothetical protein n=1 Tax=Microvirga sp. TaxID=1873136 RepID=UPI001686D968|nr:hypothetical protein [Microvirga sp.]MBD2746134.1 hypothetical protein [Microvirga sp.]
MPDVNVRTLADFKRFLARPGASIETVRNDVMMRNGQTPETRPQAYGLRQVKKLQTNAVQFTGDNWLWFDKVAKYRFAGDTVTIDVSKGEPFAEVIEYKLSFQNAA